MIEYYPNGNKKHIISYYDNGQKCQERFYDQQGLRHRDSDRPDYQCWYENGRICLITHSVHGWYHNIYNPSNIRFTENGKIIYKCYISLSKLNWQNEIKNI